MKLSFPLEVIEDKHDEKEENAMKNETPLNDMMPSSSPRMLVNNPVADSWQNRPPELLDVAESGRESLDLVGHTLNGRPLYRAWQLALLLGISPAILSTSLGGIPTNLRPFELFDEEYEANAERAVMWSQSLSKPDNLPMSRERLLSLGDLRRLTVLARTAEIAGLKAVSDQSWEDLQNHFVEF